MIFTRSELIKLARKIYRTGEWDKVANIEELQRALDRLGTLFFKLAKQNEEPEKHFIYLAESKANSTDDYTRLACRLLVTAARTACKVKATQLAAAILI